MSGSLNNTTRKPTNIPRLNGPGLNFWPPKNLAAMGIEFARYCPTTPRENIAPAAAGPANVKSPSNVARRAEKHTQLIGVPVRGLI